MCLYWIQLLVLALNFGVYAPYNCISTWTNAREGSSTHVVAVKLFNTEADAIKVMESLLMLAESEGNWKHAATGWADIEARWTGLGRRLSSIGDIGSGLDYTSDDPRLWRSVKDNARTAYSNRSFAEWIARRLDAIHQMGLDKAKERGAELFLLANQADQYDRRMRERLAQPRRLHHAHLEHFLYGWHVGDEAVSDDAFLVLLHLGAFNGNGVFVSPARSLVFWVNQEDVPLSLVPPGKEEM